MANNGQQSLWALCWKQDWKPLPQGQYWSRFNLIRNPWEIRWGQRRRRVDTAVPYSQPESWQRWPHILFMMVRLATSAVLSECGWMDGLTQAERCLIKRRGDLKETLKLPDTTQIPQVAAKIIHSELVNKTMPLLFRLHLSERAMFDESTAVIVGVRHK